MPLAPKVYYCNFCGQQGKMVSVKAITYGKLEFTQPLSLTVDVTGHFRCKRCKKTPYCSRRCQKEDWNAHRHMCMAIDPEDVT